jgi:hypothetical protein
MMTKALPAALDQKAAAEPSIAPQSKSHDFAMQLEKASKPAVKKPSDSTVTPTAPPQVQVDAPTLAQILATLVANNNPSTGVALATIPATAPDDDPPSDQVASTTATAIAAATATAVTTAAAASTANAAAQEIQQPKMQAIMQQLVAMTPETAQEPTEAPLTPLEQAVHDVLSKLDHKEAAKPEVADVAMQLAPPTMIVAAPSSSTEIKNTAPVAPMPQPQELVSQNHAHLVIDDPNGRVVMTVAIRGSEVNVSVRASDDSTAAALARNAGSLEEAMRGRGLQLAQFDSQRDLTREQREKPMHERKATVKTADGEKFTLLEESNS